jgi:hypothetical protein
VRARGVPVVTVGDPRAAGDAGGIRVAELGALAASTAAGLARGERPIGPPPLRPGLVVRDSVASLH